MTSAADIRAAKAEARRAAQARRAAAWKTWYDIGATSARDRLAAHVDAVLTMLRNAGLLGLSPAARPVVSAYLPMRTEIDPLGLLAALAGHGLGTALPVVTGRDQPLLFRAWTPGEGTVGAGFGTHEPPPGHPAVEPCLLLVPLLAFDVAGYRLGYGGGYYDRTLALSRARGRCLAVGVAFDEQKIDAVPHLDYDERLNAVLTPTGLLRFFV
jgi:5-formyltetrahydrofolate cyclo-ligase